MWFCGFTWPAAGVPGISTGYEGVWPFFPRGAPVLSDSGDFSAHPVLLPSSSAKPWVGTGCRGGREPRLLLTLAPICPKALLGLTLCSCEGTSAVSSCSWAAVGGGPGGAQAPRPARGCAPQEEGRSFSSRRKYACGLEAPLAVKSDLFPTLALCREKVSLGEGKGGACKAGSLHPSHCQRRGPRVLHPTCPLPGLPPLCFAPR